MNLRKLISDYFLAKRVAREVSSWGKGGRKSSDSNGGLTNAVGGKSFGCLILAVLALLILAVLAVGIGLVIVVLLRPVPPASNNAPGTSSTSGTPGTSIPAVETLQNTIHPAHETKQYWVTQSSRVVHNSSCQYYQNGKGEMTSDLSNTKNCSKCGGAKPKTFLGL